METQAYIIGKYYQVPTVRGYIHNILCDWPVMGPMHTDAEIINFPYEHYHIDWRFVAAEIYNWLSGRRMVHVSALTLLIDKTQSPVSGQGMNADGLPEPVLKRKKCKREFSEYPYRIVARHWLGKLEDKYQDCVIKTPVCPHRGLPLDKLPCKHDGTVTCPGHGLTWNMQTGELVRFTNAD